MNTETKTAITSIALTTNAPDSAASTTASNPSMDLADSPLNNPRIRPTRGLSRLACLTAHQLDHINAWLDESVPYREIVQLCKSEWQIEIPKTTIQRYNKRASALSLIKDLQNSREVAREISKYAATGDPSFSTNSLEVLEQQAFDLAVAYQRDHDADDLATINHLWKMIHHARNTRTRERHAAVQEEKCKLRSRELDLKQHLVARDINPNPTRETQLAAHTALHIDGDPQPASADEFKPPFRPTPGPCPLPDEIVAINRAFAVKLLAGQIDLDTGEELPGPVTSKPREGHVPPCPTSASRSATSQTNAAPADLPFPRPLGGEGQGEGVRLATPAIQSNQPNDFNQGPLQ